MPLDHQSASGPHTWLRRARSNLARAFQPKPNEALWEDYCFDAQQAAEKALKAVLVHHKANFPKTHDLSELLPLIKRLGIHVPPEVADCEVLSAFAVQTRYPGTDEPVTEDEFREALELARRTVGWAEGIIGSEREGL